MTIIERIRSSGVENSLLDEQILLEFGWSLELTSGSREPPTWRDPKGNLTSHRQGDGWFKPRASVDDALTLLDGLPRLLCLTDMGDGTWIAKLWKQPACSGNSAPEAITIAAISAQVIARSVKEATQNMLRRCPAT